MRGVSLRLLAAATLVLAGSAPPVSAQMVPPGQLVLGGMIVNCGAIPTMIQQIPDIAMARPGVILINPAMFQLPVVLQQFIYAHECAHHIGGSNERAADCWAIKTGRNQGWFREPDINWLVAYFQNSPGDWTHDPGPTRIGRLISCFRTP